MTSFAILFPGQGSQAVGMLDAWGEHPAVRDTLAEASAALGEDVAKLIREGPKEALELTTNTQPVMLTAGIACYRAWRAEGGAEPDAVAGHSLGEYTALVAADALSLSDALPLVRFRAQAMQDAVPVGTGAMAAILGLDATDVSDTCVEVSTSLGEVVEAANFNDPKQTVIAGSKAGVDKACELLKAKGAKRTLLLSVSAPFHSSLMRPAAERLAAALAPSTIRPPRVPFVSNVTAVPTEDPERIRRQLAEQVCSPVLWEQSMRWALARGVSTFLEPAPGTVLAGLLGKIAPDATVLERATPASLQGPGG